MGGGEVKIKPKAAPTTIGWQL